jgi:hypothetical protein
VLSISPLRRYALSLSIRPLPVDTPSLSIFSPSVSPLCRYALSVDMPSPSIRPLRRYALSVDTPSLSICPLRQYALCQYAFSVDTPSPSIRPLLRYSLSFDTPSPLRRKRSQLISLSNLWPDPGIRLQARPQRVTLMKSAFAPNSVIKFVT